LEGDAGAAAKGAANQLRKNDSLSVAAAHSWPSPLENAAVGKPAVKLEAAGPHHLWAWVLYDHLKSGKVSQALTMLSTLSKEG